MHVRPAFQIMENFDQTKIIAQNGMETNSTHNSNKSYNHRFGKKNLRSNT